MSPFQTHQPLLFACARHAILNGGEVIELGSGFHSTPQLYALCGKNFKSYETDKEWCHKMRCFGAPIVNVKDYDEVPIKPYALVFIDNAPEQRRAADLARFVDSKLVVIHDTNEPCYGLEPSLALYSNRVDYTFANPNTTVVSNDKKAMDEIIEMFR